MNVNEVLSTAPPDGSDGIRPLWTPRETAKFLRKSPRWVFYALRIPPSDPGSIPHVRLGRSPRFCPDTLREWVHQGCPPAAVFRAWQVAEEKKMRKCLTS